MKKREERGRTAERLEKRRNQRREMKSCWQNEVRIYSWYRGKGKENRRLTGTQKYGIIIWRQQMEKRICWNSSVGRAADS